MRFTKKIYQQDDNVIYEIYDSGKLVNSTRVDIFSLGFLTYMITMLSPCINNLEMQFKVAHKRAKIELDIIEKYTYPNNKETLNE